MANKTKDDAQWFDAHEKLFKAVLGEMEDQHLRMTFALNMICEMCRRDSVLNMGEVHRMALFGLEYAYEEADVEDEAVTAEQSRDNAIDKLP